MCISGTISCHGLILAGSGKFVYDIQGDSCVVGLLLCTYRLVTLLDHVLLSSDSVYVCFNKI